jgi:hypothetical protein
VTASAGTGETLDDYLNRIEKQAILEALSQDRFQPYGGGQAARRELPFACAIASSAWASRSELRRDAAVGDPGLTVGSKAHGESNRPIMTSARKEKSCR